MSSCWKENVAVVDVDDANVDDSEKYVAVVVDDEGDVDAAYAAVFFRRRRFHPCGQLGLIRQIASPTGYAWWGE